MQPKTSRYCASRSLIFAAALGAPLVLGGCVVEPNPYYQAQQPAYYDGASNVVYAAPAYAPAPAYYYGGPSVYIGGGCCYGGWRGGYGGRWHR